MSYDKIYKDNIVSGASIRDGKGNRIDTMYLSKSQITNCLLEVPQRIKLELNDGTLTLKAGSQVIVPNGFEADGTTPKFDYVDIVSDIIASAPYTNGPIFINYRNGQIGQANSSAQCSGTSSTISAGYWYDTTNNFINRVDSGEVSSTGLSFPLAIINASNGSWASINQVFNGMGYIGSTVWVDKGVKLLIPNGRNEDGTLRNIEFVTDKIIKREAELGSSKNVRILYNYNSSVIGFGGYDDWEFDEEKNMWVYSPTGVYYPMILLGTSTVTSNVLSNFNPKLPFRAADWSDIDSVVPTGTIVAFASTTTPTGFLYCNGANISRTAYAKLFNVIGTTYGTGDGSTTYALPNLSTAQFVTSSTASVYGNGKGLVLSNGSVEYGIQNDCDSSACAWGKSSTNIGASIGAASNRNTALLKTIFGVTTNPTKSGLTSKLSTTTLRWYIKY